MGTVAPFHYHKSLGKNIWQNRLETSQKNCVGDIRKNIYWESFEQKKLQLEEIF